MLVGKLPRVKHKNDQITKEIIMSAYGVGG
jgi:hypothetical protein